MLGTKRRKRVFANYVHLPNKPDTGAFSFQLPSKEFQEALSLGDFVRAQEELRAWFKEVVGKKPSWVELKESCEAAWGFIRREEESASPIRSVPQALAAPQKFIDASSYQLYFLELCEIQMKKLQESRQENRVVETVKNFIHRHYSEELELGRLAEEVFLTPSYLSKLFKTETGETITDYWISVRMEKAKELLRENQSLKTYEVGEQVGYGDPAYFNKVFKKVVGSTPKEFRSRVR